MKIDVSDLFDDLFTVAAVAYSQFRVSHEELNDYPETDWDRFCSQISDSLFLPACASRAYDAISQRMKPSDLKRRIIAQRIFGYNSDCGMNIWYSRPRFFWGNSPSGFESYYNSFGQVQRWEFSARPTHSLILHLGRIPDDEFRVQRPAYDPNWPSSKTYYCEHGCIMMSGPKSILYEMHGDWCLREVELSDSIYREVLDTPRWMETSNLTQIDQGTFDKMWAIAAEHRRG